MEDLKRIMINSNNSGVIHWTWASKVRPMCLDPKRYYIIHDTSLGYVSMLWPKYAIIETLSVRL